MRPVSPIRGRPATSAGRPNRLAWPAGLALLVIVAACSDQPVAPDRVLPDYAPVLSVGTQGNGNGTGSGACMGDDARTWPDFVSGINSTSPDRAFNCTSNDVRVAEAIGVNPKAS
jgi:hypothetical protein